MDSIESMIRQKRGAPSIRKSVRKSNDITDRNNWKYTGYITQRVEPLIGLGEWTWEGELKGKERTAVILMSVDTDAMKLIFSPYECWITDYDRVDLLRDDYSSIQDAIFATMHAILKVLGDE